MKRGIRWGLTDRLEDLDYADDICLLAHNHTDMQANLDAVTQYASKAGLKINIAKTKAMKVMVHNTANFTINGSAIEQVNSFTYLGSVIVANGGSSADIKERIRKAQAAFSKLSPIWRSQQICRNTKIRIFESSVKSVLLYACETWNLLQKDAQALQSFVNRCLRKIMHVFWPNTIQNTVLWQATKQKTIVIEITKRKWNWLGHSLRRSNNDITRNAVEWNPQGSRRRGRPSNTWRRMIEMEMEKTNKTWNEIKLLAQNRDQWKQFVEALCST